MRWPASDSRHTPNVPREHLAQRVAGSRVGLNRQPDRRSRAGVLAALHLASEFLTKYPSHQRQLAAAAGDVQRFQLALRRQASRGRQRFLQQRPALRVIIRDWNASPVPCLREPRPGRPRSAANWHAALPSAAGTPHPDETDRPIRASPVFPDPPPAPPESNRNRRRPAWRFRRRRAPYDSASPAPPARRRTFRRPDRRPAMRPVTFCRCPNSIDAADGSFNNPSTENPARRNASTVRKR